MAKGFTIEEHEKRMREILNQKPKTGDQRSNLLKTMLEKAKRSKLVR